MINKKTSNTQVKNWQNKQNTDEKTEENEYPDGIIQLKSKPKRKKQRMSESQIRKTETQMRKSQNKQQPSEKLEQ